VQRILVYTLIAALTLFGVGMMLSLTAGGFTFGLGFFSAALALWLLYRTLLALELSTDLMAQSLLQYNKVVKNQVEEKSGKGVTTGHSEPSREEPRPSQLAAGD